MKCIINDLPIYYEIHGEGKPVLALHRFTEDHGFMKGALEPFFADKPGYRRIYLDMPGMGKTPAADWIVNADVMLDTLKKFVAEIIGEEDFLLVGASYGAYMSLGMAYDEGMNIDGMFLFNPCTVPNSDERIVPDDVDTFEEDGIEELVEAEGVENSDNYFDEAIWVNQANWARYRDEILPAYSLTDSDFCENYRENGYALSFHDKLSTLNFEGSVTILTGRYDDSAGYEDSWNLLKHLPSLTFVSLDKVGPLMHIENQTAFNFHLNEWLNRINCEN